MTEQGNPPTGRFVLDDTPAITMLGADGVWRGINLEDLINGAAGAADQAARKAVADALTAVFTGIQSLGKPGPHARCQIDRADALAVVREAMQRNRENGDQS